MTDVIVSQSKIHGIGVFATRDFHLGEIILQIDDSRLVDEENPLNPQIGEFEHHCDYLANGRTVLMKSPERHINSSCDPNIYVKTIDGIRYVAAYKNIKAGGEIAYDYSINCDGGIIWECSCGSNNCRQTIVSGFFDLPVELQLKYLPILDDWFIDEHQNKVARLLVLKNKS